MKFRTEITIRPSVNKIDQSQRLLSVGSCFAEEVALHLAEVGVETLSNPLGALYNPLSIEACVERIVENRKVEHNELMCRGDVWFSLDSHGCYDDPDPRKVVESINGAVVDAHEWLGGCRWVVLTLGTAWVYEYGGRVVANCHKMPAKEFVRRRLTVEEVVASLERTLAMLPDRRVILSVSPVRHLGDGLEGNALSKATLRLAVEEVVSRHERVCYFPSYEIFIDDLRDYRYCADDMTHPSKAGVDYVWERFCDAFMGREALADGELFARLAAASAHRPLHPESEEHRTFRESMFRKALTLTHKFPKNRIAEALMKFFA